MLRTQLIVIDLNKDASTFFAVREHLCCQRVVFSLITKMFQDLSKSSKSSIMRVTCVKDQLDMRLIRDFL